jgi:protocatechuate 3,4-dioxygenase beta subunit
MVGAGPSPQLSRRRLLVAGTATLVLAACADDGGDAAEGTATTTATDVRTRSTSTTSAAGTDTTALTGADFASLGTCLLLPEATAGPFPLDEQFNRRDITEGYPGHPIRLGLRVLDGGCAPVPNSIVEVWHTDATGDYSAFADSGGGKDEDEGTTFLRGSQTADDEGIVEFLTIYPGWYPGRAVHIHVRVHVDDATILTSQLYFDEPYTESVYATGAYAEFGNPDTSLDEDSIAGDAESNGSLLVTSAAETTKGNGTLGLLNLGVDV